MPGTNRVPWLNRGLLQSTSCPGLHSPDSFLDLRDSKGLLTSCPGRSELALSEASKLRGVPSNLDR